MSRDVQRSEQSQGGKSFLEEGWETFSFLGTKAKWFVRKKCWNKRSERQKGHVRGYQVEGK